MDSRVEKRLSTDPFTLIASWTLSVEHLADLFTRLEREAAKVESDGKCTKDKVHTNRRS